jgi:Flp pilus assembly protein TadD
VRRHVGALSRHADPNTWYNLGIAYQRLGRRADAARAFRRADAGPRERIPVDPDDSDE